MESFSVGLLAQALIPWRGLGARNILPNSQCVCILWAWTSPTVGISCSCFLNPRLAYFLSKLKLENNQYSHKAFWDKRNCAWMNTYVKILLSLILAKFLRFNEVKPFLGKKSLVMWEHKEKYLKIVDRLSTLLFYTMSDPHNGQTLTLLLTYPEELGSWFILWL